MQPNRLKRRLREGRLTTGCWLFMGSPVVTEVLSTLGTESLIVDLEHSPGSIETAVHQLRAGQSQTMLVRVNDAEAKEIKPLLDAGFQGVFAANVQTAAQVEHLVAACRYPPHGNRGLHYTVSRAADWGSNSAAYAEHAAESTLIVAMIESARGVAAIPEMTQIPGLDMLFIGPLDLSASIGVAGQYDHPEFLELWTEAERRCLESDVALGGAVLPGHSLIDLAERGYRFVTIGSDVTWLRMGAEQAFKVALPKTQ